MSAGTTMKTQSISIFLTVLLLVAPMAEGLRFLRKGGSKGGSRGKGGGDHSGTAHRSGAGGDWGAEELIFIVFVCLVATVLGVVRAANLLHKHFSPGLREEVMSSSGYMRSPVVGVDEEDKMTGTRDSDKVEATDNTELESSTTEAPSSTTMRSEDLEATIVRATIPELEEKKQASAE
jgi:hypothetical protein